MNLFIGPVSAGVADAPRAEGQVDGCGTCAHLGRRVERLGQLRFQLQKQVNEIEARARTAEARIRELEARQAPADSD